VLLACASFTPVAQAGTNRWTSAGPNGAYVRSIGVDPVHPGVIYMGSQGAGGFKSSDGGQTWASIHVASGSPVVNAFAVDPASGTVFAATSIGGVFRSSDGGTSWTPSSSGMVDLNVGSLALATTLPCTLYAGTLSGDLYRSDDCGASWAHPLSFRNPVVRIAIDPTDTSRLYVIAGPSVYLLTDGGATLFYRSVGLEGLGPLALALDPGSPDTVYVATYFGWVYKTVNAGIDWTPANAGLALDRFESLVAVPSTSPAVLYAGTDLGGIYKSVDGAASWTPVNSGLGSVPFLYVWSLAVDPSSPGTVYAGSFGGGVFRTTSSGASWTLSISGVTDSRVHDLAIHPTQPGGVFAAASLSGFFESADGAASWSSLGFGQTDRFINAVAVDPSNPATLYLGTGEGGVFKSVDGGVGWSPANVGLSPSASVFRLALAPSAPATIYAGLIDGTGVFKSTDGAASWNAVNNGLPAGTVEAPIVVHPSNANVAYAAIFGGGLFRTADGGGLWTRSGGVMPDFYLEALAIDPTAPQTLYAAPGDYGGVWKTTDGGATWNPLLDMGTRFVISLAVDPGDGQRVYAGTTTTGVYRSLDGGATWSAFNLGIENREIESIVVDTRNGVRRIYAGAGSGGAFELHEVPRQFFSLAPCRLADTRSAAGPLGGPALAANQERTFVAAGSCGVPPTALALALNVAVTQGSNAGQLRLYPAGIPPPNATAINYGAGRTRSNNAIVALGDAGDFSVWCDQADGAVDAIFDVYGYFE
jgi:photosystem II stability/assembly factor-like uncharacterized protein